MTSTDNHMKRKSSFGETEAAARNCDEFESFSSSFSPSSLNDLGVEKHKRGDVSEALIFYQRALQMKLEGSSQANDDIVEGNKKRRRRCGPSPAPYHRHGESWSLLEPSPADVDSADNSSSLIGMGRFVVPLTMSDFSSSSSSSIVDEGDKDILTPLVLYNTSLAKIANTSSSKALLSAKSLLELALLDLDNKAPESAASTERNAASSSFVRLRLMVLTNLGVTRYRLEKFGDAFDAFRRAAVAATDLMPRPEQAHPAKGADANRCSSLRRRSILRCLIYLLLNCARARDAQGGIEKAADSSSSSSSSKQCREEALVLVREARSLCDNVLKPASIPSADKKEEEDVEGNDNDYDAELSFNAAFIEAVLLRRRRRRGDIKRAAELYSQCIRSVAAMESHQQPRRPIALRAAAALHGLGEALFELRSLSSCLAPLRTAWSLRRAHLGEDHPDSIESMYALARALHDSEEMTDASTLYERVHRLQKRALGPGHVETLKTLCNLARCHRACGRGQEALDACDEAVRAGTDALGGDDHPYVLEMKMIRAAVLRELGRTREGYVAFGELVRRAAAGGEGEGDDSDSGWLVKRVHRLLAEFLREPCLGGMDSGAAAA